MLNPEIQLHGARRLSNEERRSSSHPSAGLLCSCAKIGVRWVMECIRKLNCSSSTGKVAASITPGSLKLVFRLGGIILLARKLDMRKAQASIVSVFITTVKSIKGSSTTVKNEYNLKPEALKSTNFGEVDSLPAAAMRERVVDAVRTHQVGLLLLLWEVLTNCRTPVESVL